MTFELEDIFDVSTIENLLKNPVPKNKEDLFDRLKLSADLYSKFEGGEEIGEGIPAQVASKIPGVKEIPYIEEIADLAPLLIKLLSDRSQKKNIKPVKDKKMRKFADKLSEQMGY